MTQAITSGRAGLHPIILGGTIAGILDILAAFGYSAARGGPPVRVLQAIASGVLGASAFQGGTATAALGLFLHFVIAFGAAAVYYGASRLLPFLVRRPIVSGLAYGFAVFVFMQHVVLPLSRGNFRHSPWHVAIVMIVIHMLCVGLPIALAVSRGTASR